MGVSTLTLAVSGLCAPAAFADPAITYSGSLSPAPLPTTTTNWTPNGNITMGLDGDSTLTVSGGATITAPESKFTIGATAAPGHNSTFTIDGAGTKVDLYNIITGLGNGSNDKLVVSGGASLDVVVGSIMIARGEGKGQDTLPDPGTASMLVTGAGTNVQSGGGISVGGASNTSASLRVEDGAMMTSSWARIGNGGDLNPEGSRYGEVIVSGNGTVLTVGKGGVANNATIILGAEYPSLTPAWGQVQGVLTISDGATVRVLGDQSSIQMV